MRSANKERSGKQKIVFYLFLAISLILVIAASYFIFDSNLLQRIHSHPPVGSPLLQFSALDITGKQISDSDFQHGRTILFLPGEENSINLQIADRIELFEKVEKINFAKVSFVGDSDDFRRRTWVTIQSSETREKIKNTYSTSFMVAFEDGSLLGGFVMDGAPLSDIDLNSIHKGLYRFYLGIESAEGILRWHAPSDWIDPSLLYSALSTHLGDSEDQFILLVNDARVPCGSGNVLKEFSKRILFNTSSDGVIYLGPAYAAQDIRPVKLNYKVLLNVIHGRADVDSLYIELIKLSFTTRINILFRYRKGEYVDSCYVYGTCEEFDLLMERIL